MNTPDAVYDYFTLPLVGFYRNHKVFIALCQLCKNDAAAYMRGASEYGHRMLYRLGQIANFLQMKRVIFLIRLMQ